MQNSRQLINRFGNSFLLNTQLKEISMADFQKEKQIVLKYYDALDSAKIEEIPEICGNFVSEDCLWQSYHPFKDQKGGERIATQFWIPFKVSFQRLQRRQDIFFAGQNEINKDGSIWVVSMGHLMGLFDKNWISIPATEKMAFLRYAEFNRVEKDKIVETALYFDIPHLMSQVGLNPFPNSMGANIIQPGPLTHEGLYYLDQPADEGNKTSKAIDHMIDTLGNWNNSLSICEELALSWHDNMIWWGPTGIGATYTIERYAKQHAGPFRTAFSDRKFNGHISRVTEGYFGGFFGRPNLTLTLTNTFMGFPPTNLRADMNIVDIYRRDRGKLAENWIFIDLLGFWMQHGIDILGNITKKIIINN